MGSCTAVCLKVLLAIVNVIFFLAGGVILGVGIWLRSDDTLALFKGEESLEKFQYSLYAGAYVLIAFGSFTFLVGFCGCCGALCENQCLLGIYIALISVILAAEIAGGVSVFMKKDDLVKNFRDTAFKYLHDSYTGNNDTANHAWNFVMFQFECCGINGYRDFNETSKFRKSQPPNSGLIVPLVCCVQRDSKPGEINIVNQKECEAAAANANNPEKDSEFLNEQGCYTLVSEWIIEHSDILIGVAAGVAGFELLVIIAASIFCCQIRKQTEW